MKAELKFEYDTEDSSQVDEIKMLQNASTYKTILWEIDQYLRSRIKYEEISEEVGDALQLVRDKLHEELNEHNITMD